MHTAGPECSVFTFMVSVESYNSPSTDQIHKNFLRRTQDSTLFIMFGSMKNFLRSGRSQLQ